MSIKLKVSDFEDGLTLDIILIKLKHITDQPILYTSVEIDTGDIVGQSIRVGEFDDLVKEILDMRHNQIENCSLKKSILEVCFLIDGDHGHRIYNYTIYNCTDINKYNEFKNNLMPNDNDDNNGDSDSDNTCISASEI